MKRGMVLWCAVLFIFCLGAIFISCGGQSQDPNFMENEKQAWEDHAHRICERLFGFAWGRGEWSGQIFSKSDIFDWVAVADWEGFITIRTSKLIPKRITKKFLGLSTDFHLSASGSGAVIKVLNNRWIGTHCQSKKALEDELQIIYEKTGLKMAVITHESLR